MPMNKVAKRGQNIKDLNKIDFLPFTHFWFRNFISKEQVAYIKQNYDHLMNNIYKVYNPSLYDYTDYNNQLVRVYEYLENIKDLKGLFNHFINVISNHKIIRTNSENFDIALFKTLKLNDKNKSYFENVYEKSMPKLILQSDKSLMNTKFLYRTLSKPILNLFLKFLFFVKEFDLSKVPYSKFQGQCSYFVQSHRILFSGTYENLE